MTINLDDTRRYVWTDAQGNAIGCPLRLTLDAGWQQADGGKSLRVLQVRELPETIGARLWQVECCGDQFVKRVRVVGLLPWSMTDVVDFARDIAARAAKVSTRYHRGELRGTHIETIPGKVVRICVMADGICQAAARGGDAQMYESLETLAWQGRQVAQAADGQWLDTDQVWSAWEPQVQWIVDRINRNERARAA